MRDNFFFTITNKKKYLYTIFANILLLLNFIFFALIKFNLYQSKICTSLTSCIVIPCFIVLLFLFRFYYTITKRNLSFTNLHYALLASFLWASIYNWQIAIAILLLGLFEYLVNKDIDCTINHNGITLHTIPIKKYEWKDLSNVLWENGIFTIDQKNNRLFQVDISEEVIPFQKEEFVAFVSSHLGFHK